MNTSDTAPTGLTVGNAVRALPGAWYSYGKEWSAFLGTLVDAGMLPQPIANENLRLLQAVSEDWLLSCAVIVYCMSHQLYDKLQTFLEASLEQIDKGGKKSAYFHHHVSDATLAIFTTACRKLLESSLTGMMDLEHFVMDRYEPTPAVAIDQFLRQMTPDAYTFPRLTTVRQVPQLSAKLLMCIHLIKQQKTWFSREWLQVGYPLFLHIIQSLQDPRTEEAQGANPLPDRQLQELEHMLDVHLDQKGARSGLPSITDALQLVLTGNNDTAQGVAYLVGLLRSHPQGRVDERQATTIVTHIDHFPTLFAYLLTDLYATNLAPLTTRPPAAQPALMYLYRRLTSPTPRVPDAGDVQVEAQVLRALESYILGRFEHRPVGKSGRDIRVVLSGHLMLTGGNETAAATPANAAPSSQQPLQGNASPPYESTLMAQPWEESASNKKRSRSRRTEATAPQTNKKGKPADTQPLQGNASPPYKSTLMAQPWEESASNKKRSRSRRTEATAPQTNKKRKPADTQPLPYVQSPMDAARCPPLEQLAESVSERIVELFERIARFNTTLKKLLVNGASAIDERPTGHTYSVDEIICSTKGPASEVMRLISAESKRILRQHILRLPATATIPNVNDKLKQLGAYLAQVHKLQKVARDQRWPYLVEQMFSNAQDGLKSYNRIKRTTRCGGHMIRQKVGVRPRSVSASLDKFHRKLDTFGIEANSLRLSIIKAEQKCEQEITKFLDCLAVTKKQDTGNRAGHKAEARQMVAIIMSQLTKARAMRGSGGSSGRPDSPTVERLPSSYRGKLDAMVKDIENTYFAKTEKPT